MRSTITVMAKPVAYEPMTLGNMRQFGMTRLDVVPRAGLRQRAEDDVSAYDFERAGSAVRPTGPKLRGRSALIINSDERQSCAEHIRAVHMQSCAAHIHGDHMPWSDEPLH